MTLLSCRHSPVSSPPTGPCQLPGEAGQTKIADYMVAWLEHRGIANYRIETDSGRPPSITGIVRGSGGGKEKSLMFNLNGHSDTVTVSLASDDQDSLLSGQITEIKEGRQVVVRRESLDTKGGLAAAMSTMSAVKASGDFRCVAR
jgi:acetylornithine deacetylase/succinyl-diaminopimelate desuccinylase-like protein